MNRMSVKAMAEGHMAAAEIEIRKHIDRIRGIAKEFAVGEWHQFAIEQLDDLQQDVGNAFGCVLEAIEKSRH